MTNAAVLSLLTDQYGWSYLDSSSPVHGLTFEWTYPGGPSSAQCTLDAAPGAYIPRLGVGSSVALRRGTSVLWPGRVSSVDRDGWQVQYDGLAGLAAREPVTTTGTLDAILDAAIANGLPWTRPASLSTTT